MNFLRLVVLESIIEILVKDYLAGESISQLSRKHGIKWGCIRYNLAKRGVTRTSGEGVKLAIDSGTFIPTPKDNASF